jgi:hypothetical protein
MPNEINKQQNVPKVETLELCFSLLNINNFKNVKYFKTVETRVVLPWNSLTQEMLSPGPCV